MKRPDRKEIFDVYAKTSEKVLQHKLEDGMQADDRYCFWTRKSQYKEICEFLCADILKEPRRGPRVGHSVYTILGYPKAWIWADECLGEKDTNMTLKDMEVRLHLSIDGKERGHFKCFGANKDFTELWFHSEDWVPAGENTGG